MAVSAFTFTDPGFLACLKCDINVEDDTIVAVLIDNAHTPNKETEDTYADISANVCTDADYAPQTVTGLAWTDTGSRTFKLDHSLINFGDAVTISARYCYFIKQAGGSPAGTDLIVGYYDLNDGGAANVSSTASDFDVDANASNGAFQQTITPS